MKKPVFYLVLAVITLTFSCCKKSDISEFKVAFYNVENLFDTINDPGVNDGSFTPQSALNWNTYKYGHKLEGIAKVLTALGDGELPVVVGLAEVENERVLNDLVRQPALKKGGYRYVHYESPDERGIDVALLYRSDYFEPLYSRAYPVRFPFDTSDRTRDLLYVKGVAATGDTLHIMIDHWPSRYGGKEKSAPKRNFTASLVRDVVDSVFKTNSRSNIIIMGDLNDNPTDESVTKILKAMKPGNLTKYDELYNLALPEYEKGKGTLYWKSWDLFDQIIVSGNILSGNMRLKLDPEKEQILKEDWMLYQRDDGVKVPSRTAGRKAYYGGYSDHLPVYINFVVGNSDSKSK
jgi:predicted extracellular nuclease